jgi:hypothetical protein
MATYLIVDKRIDTWFVNVRGKLDESMMEELDRYKEAAQEIEEPVPTRWAFLGKTLHIRPTGSGAQWRWTGFCGEQHYLHLDIGKGKLNGIICKARLSSLLLHEVSEGVALYAVHDFLITLFGEAITLQSSEVHCCVDVAGLAFTLDDAARFVTYSKNRQAILIEDGEAEQAIPEIAWDGRKLSGMEFSKTGIHACAIYDKTREVRKHHKEWFYEVWKAHGWDGEATVTRIEFRYGREWLRTHGIEDPYDMLDQLDGMWAYSTQIWLRHACPDGGQNPSRWGTSEVWEVVQSAIDDVDAVPSAKVKKMELDAERTKAGTFGYLSSLAVRLVAFYEQASPEERAAMMKDRKGLPLRAVDEDGGGYLEWLYEVMKAYHKEKKAKTFVEVMREKAVKLGLLLEDKKGA